jgi:hypothetical protein
MVNVDPIAQAEIDRLQKREQRLVGALSEARAYVRNDLDIWRHNHCVNGEYDDPDDENTDREMWDFISRIDVLIGVWCCLETH